MLKKYITYWISEIINLSWTTIYLRYRFGWFMEEKLSVSFIRNFLYPLGTYIVFLPSRRTRTNSDAFHNKYLRHLITKKKHIPDRNRYINGKSSFTKSNARKTSHHRHHHAKRTSRECTRISNFIPLIPQTSRIPTRRRIPPDINWIGNERQ